MRQDGLILAKRKVRRTKGDGTLVDDFLNDVLRLIEFQGHLLIRQGVEFGMSEGVVADLVSFRGNATRQIGLCGNSLADHEESREDVAALEFVEDTFGHSRSRTVVEGECDSIAFRGKPVDEGIGAGHAFLARVGSCSG